MNAPSTSTADRTFDPTPRSTSVTDIATDVTVSTVPFVDLALQNAQVADAVAAGFERVLSTQGFVLGPEVARFEEAFASYCGVSDVVGVGNGTDALEIALVSAGIGPGDEVIVPANTFVATAEAVVRVGAELVLADCDDDFLIAPESVVDRATGRTRAVIAVHLYGQVARVEVLRDALGAGVLIVEDAAQAQGATRGGVRAGALGDVAATSFYPGKNLGAYGDAGALMTSSVDVADQARMLRNHGGVARYEHQEIGRNSRLDGLQAAVLSAKLPVLDRWNQERRRAAARYDELLAGVVGIRTPRTLPGNEHVHHLYVVRVRDRDRVLGCLQAAGIGTGIHYPAPIHLIPAFAHLGLRPGEFPAAERAAGEILSLPMFPGITAAQQERVADVLVEAVRWPS
ncbi:DegT/DnrJ/EryC1/StrS family aminotransferase [Nocardioides conyzicola]|uniref:DegT/DnrJ/EryC1/StrS family aminotransferase n=1 Tax=Nocardioides conyzicola TaxID=1651781 RepID=A0ABP8XNY9_9ACTN